MLKMKNKTLIALIISISFLLISCSKNKKETALENCADSEFITFKDPSYDNELGSRVGTIVSRWGKNKSADEYLKKGYTMNEKLRDEKSAHTGKVSKTLLNRWTSTEKFAMNSIKTGYDVYKMYAGTIVKKTSLKKKSKVELYSNFLIDCEKLYNETPDSFVLKWNN